MKKSKSFLILGLCLTLCLGAFACGLNGNNSGSTTGGGNTNTSATDNPSLEDWISGMGKTSFSSEEEDRFLSTVGFVIPYVQNREYKIGDYVGYNGDLMAYENGLYFYTDGLTEDECKAYIDNLKNDENYNFEYPQDGYYYFSRFVGEKAYFVKVEYNWHKTCWGLDVYVYSYTFEDVESSDTATDSESSNTGTEEDLPVEPVGLIYEDNSARGYYSVIGFGICENSIVEIPDTYKGLPVTEIGANAFYGREDITEVIFGDNVQYILGNAFMLCTNLEKVSLGNSLIHIDQSVFLGCEKLEEITIPATVNFIGAGAFKKCYNLKSIILENPEGWHTSSNLHKDFPVEDMSNAEMVAEYFTETYVSKAWMKDR